MCQQARSGLVLSLLANNESESSNLNGGCARNRLHAVASTILQPHCYSCSQTTYLPRATTLTLQDHLHFQQTIDPTCDKFGRDASIVLDLIMRADPALCVQHICDHDACRRAVTDDTAWKF